MRTTNQGEICSHGTRELRNWSRERDAHILQRYKLCSTSTWCSQRPAYQIDHLIPLGIGGADNDDNLWPQPRQEAEMKDKLEWRMRDLVCKYNYDAGKLQQEIRDDWTKAYHKYVE